MLFWVAFSKGAPEVTALVLKISRMGRREEAARRRPRASTWGYTCGAGTVGTCTSGMESWTQVCTRAEVETQRSARRANAADPARGGPGDVDGPTPPAVKPGRKRHAATKGGEKRARRRSALCNVKELTRGT
jgi:hypothetical protein